MEKVCSENFIKIFGGFEKRLNAFFQKNTKIIQGGNVRNPKKAVWYQYRKKLISKDDVAIEIRILYDRENDDYIYYSYNIIFGNNKLMFHYEPTHKEHFQPHVDVYAEGNELKNFRGEGIHILSHKYHPLEILAVIERYFA